MQSLFFYLSDAPQLFFVWYFWIKAARSRKTLSAWLSFEKADFFVFILKFELSTCVFYFLRTSFLGLKRFAMSKRYYLLIILTIFARFLWVFTVTLIWFMLIITKNNFLTEWLYVNLRFFYGEGSQCLNRWWITFSKLRNNI